MAIEEKSRNQARWKTQKGFQNLDKKVNPNVHPKKLDQAKVDELTIPYHLQREDTQR